MDKQAFSERILQMEPALYSVARTYLHTPHDCADAVQEAVLKAWASRHTLRREDAFRPWVIRILINQCNTQLRRGKRMVPVESVPDTPAPPEADPWLHEAVMALDIKYRAPFVLHYVEGYTTAEIGHMLHIPKGTVLSRLHRARRVLQADWRHTEEEVFGHEG